MVRMMPMPEATETVEPTAELLVDGVEPAHPVISPDGRLVAYLVSTDDTNVPAGQAVYFHRALSRYGVEHELVIYPARAITSPNASTRSTCSAASAPGSPAGSAPREAG
jgi:hypothetical protein